MTLARTWAVTLTGVEGRLVEVEADLAQGLPGCTIVGLPDTALSQARDRVRAAVVNSHIPWPQKRITVGLSPASLPKRGSAFDLAVAVAVLAAAGAVPVESCAGLVLTGELGLDGRTRPVPGVLQAALLAREVGRGRLVCPTANGAEAALVRGLEVVPVSSLVQLVAVLRGEGEPDDVPVVASPESAPGEAVDLADVVGQTEARRALEVCAAGGHHLLLHGPPGAGKTMLAERLAGLLPELDVEDALEVTAVHSVAGRLREGAPLVTRPPFVAPHHTASVVSMVGGGSAAARPGAVSLAHRGVLFLDEAPDSKYTPRLSVTGFDEPSHTPVLVTLPALRSPDDRYAGSGSAGRSVGSHSLRVVSGTVGCTGGSRPRPDADTDYHSRAADRARVGRAYPDCGAHTGGSPGGADVRDPDAEGLPEDRQGQLLARPGPQLARGRLQASGPDRAWRVVGSATWRRDGGRGR